MLKVIPSLISLLHEGSAENVLLVVGSRGNYHSADGGVLETSGIGS